MIYTIVLVALLWVLIILQYFRISNLKARNHRLKKENDQLVFRNKALFEILNKGK